MGKPDTPISVIVTVESKSTAVVVQQSTKIDAETRIKTEQRTEADLSTGDRVGRKRVFEEDKNSTNQRIIIKNAHSSIIKAAKIAAEEKPSGEAISSKQITRELQNLSFVVKKNQPDLERVFQKNQRTCNHLYSKSSKRCLYCSKHRDSHVYDTVDKSIFKVKNSRSGTDTSLP